MLLVTRPRLTFVHRDLFSSQQRCNLSRAAMAAASIAASRNAASIGCVILNDAPAALMTAFTLPVLQSIVACLQEGRGHLRLQGKTHVQGGCMVLEPLSNLLQFSTPARELELACFDHIRSLLEDEMGNKVPYFF